MTAHQIPSKYDRGIRKRGYPLYEEWEEAGTHSYETNTDYLNKHALEWAPPSGPKLHLHLIYSHQVHWRVVGQGSAVCLIPGRCYKISIAILNRGDEQAK